MVSGKLITIKKNAEFKRVYSGSRETVKNAANKQFVILVMPNGLLHNRFGITISRKVGKAVTRNKLRRRIREILRTCLTDGLGHTGNDIVIIAKPGAPEYSFRELRIGLDKLLMKLLPKSCKNTEQDI